ncbi:MAG: DUF2336 domain-containing protein [Pseudomonadota bacterium]
MLQANAVTDLIALAQEPSSDKRRELLHSITDLFLTSDSHPEETQELFGSVLEKVSETVEVEDRTVLAERLAPVGFAPHGLMSKLAHDEATEVATPVLQNSEVLTDRDLVSVANKRGDSHMLAMASRPSLGPQVTDVLVERGSQNVLHAVSANEGAKFSDDGATVLATRAADDEVLQDSLSRRTDLPSAAQNIVGQQIKQRSAFGKRGQDSGDVEPDGPMKSLLSAITKEFSAVSGIEPERIRKMILQDRMDLLVIICRALDVSESVFERLVRYRVKLSGGVQPSMDGLLSQFRTLPPHAAQRMARFLKVRASASS